MGNSSTLTGPQLASSLHRLSMSEPERRPNPPGWVPPKAPYNPYDPTDLRPPAGYPSEFQSPGKPRGWSKIPKEPSNYRSVQDTLKKLHYVPRPLSEVYPGQYKVLRRLGPTRFQQGVKYSSTILTGAIIIGALFFYRWNDGKDNIFSTTYKLQLRIRDALFANLSMIQKGDLDGRQHEEVPAHTDSKVQLDISAENRDVYFERPKKKHIMESERIRQERDEKILRAVDIAEAELAKQQSSQQQSKKRWGLF